MVDFRAESMEEKKKWIDALNDAMLSERVMELEMARQNTVKE
jgi:hypothetical protein